MLKLSIIIPTFKEEKYLPTLLLCLENQTFQDFEVIISDANSPDRTREIAKEFGAKDVDFIKRVAQNGYKFRVLSTKYKPSDRRYTKIGWSKVIAGSVIGGISVGLGVLAAQKMAEKMYGGWGEYDKTHVQSEDEGSKI